MVTKLGSFLLAVGCLGAPLVAVAQIPAFSGAEGAGANAQGGRPRMIGSEVRGQVYHVTTLDADPTGTIPGSLRYGMRNENFLVQYGPVYEPSASWTYDVIPRIIVFDVGGTIDLTSGGDIDTTPMNFTLAGQTAPGGITIYGREFNPGHRDAWDNTPSPLGQPPKTNNLIIRNLTMRTNDAAEKDGIWVPASNSIVDHVTVSWYTDEGVSITDGAKNLTVQHSIIGPGWNSPDGDGSQIEGHTPFADISVHHNLYIHNDARIPRVGEKTETTGGPGVELDFRNNVIYNWNDSRAGYGVSGENSYSNFVNNYYIGGAGTSSTTILSVPGGSAGQTHRVYQSGNLMDQNKNGVADGTDLGWTAFTGNEAQQVSPYSVPHGVTQTPAEALDTVTNYAGANWWDRDFLDERAINQLMTFGNSSLPNSERGQVLNSIAPADVSAVLNAPMQTRAASWDTDNDGMPDWWEIRHGFDPNSDTDWDGDADGDGYVNLEEYINEIAEWAAPDAIQWSGGNARYAEILNWGITRPNPGEADTTTNWQPSRFDTAVIDNGTVAVDAVGQHARFVRMATNSGDSATLDITAGWLKVEEELEVGVHAAATAAVNLSGGTLSVGELSLGSGGSFSFTGGTLSADEVNFDLANDGGTIAPGQEIASFNHNGPTPASSVGQMHVAGDLTISDGTLAIELASDMLFDSVLVDDAATLAGNLEVALLGGFIPDSTDQFEILTADSRSGDFAGATSVDAYLGFFDVTYTATSVLLSNFQLVGDYNGNGQIDPADYTVWRDSLGNEVEEGTGADGNRNGEIDADDFLRWRLNFGLSVDGGGGGHGTANVPEPASISLAMLSLLVFAGYRRKGGCR